MNKFRTSERFSGLLAFVLSGLSYAAAGLLFIFFMQQCLLERRPAMGPQAVNLSFAQVELKAAEVPPEPAPVIPEKADVALEEIPEQPEPRPEPVPAPAQVVQEAAAPEAPVESAEPLTGAVQEIDWSGIAVAKVRAMVEREKYYPAAARNAGYTGWCRVRIFLAAGGTVTAFKIEERRGHPLLGRAVETTLGKIQGQKIGLEMPQPLEVPLTIEFELK